MTAERAYSQLGSAQHKSGPRVTGQSSAGTGAAQQTPTPSAIARQQIMEVPTWRWEAGGQRGGAAARARDEGWAVQPRSRSPGGFKAERRNA